ncbi:MAG: hypothetical protein PHV23_02415 [Candidatus Gracilibacteria bacterium]|nr:hypothetical protein [Candidatus Gracilibacteria bacterium]
METNNNYEKVDSGLDIKNQLKDLSKISPEQKNELVNSLKNDTELLQTLKPTFEELLKSSEISAEDKALLQEVSDSLFGQENVINTTNESNESIDLLSQELKPENIDAINNFTKSTTINGKFTPGHQVFLFNAVGNTLQNQFPEIAKGLKILGSLNGTPDSSDSSKIMTKINEMQAYFNEKGFFINTDVISTGNNLIMKIDGKREPSDVVSNVLGEDLGELKQNIVLDDASFEKFGYNLGENSIVNKGYIRDFIEKGGQFSPEDRAKLLKPERLDNIALATINHETVHSVLDEKYNFPKRMDYNEQQSTEWAIDGLDFKPNNSIQVEEFIAHSVGQSTDNYEIRTNIMSALQDMGEGNFDNFSITNKSGEGSDYALVRSFILSQLKDIFKSKGITNFDELSLKKLESIYSERRQTISRNDQLLSEGKQEESEQLLEQWNANGAIKFENNFNQYIKDIVGMLSVDDFKTIQTNFNTQAQKYMQKIKQQKQ